MKRRFYVDGKLKETGRDLPVEERRRHLDNLEREWSRNLEDARLDPEAMRGTNQGKKVMRISPDELIVITTEDKTLRWININ